MKPLCEFLKNKYIDCKKDNYRENYINYKDCQMYFDLLKACTYYLE